MKDTISFFIGESYIVASLIGQRLHEMILKPPVEIGDLLHLVSVSFFLLGKKFGHELKLFEKKISQCIVITYYLHESILFTIDMFVAFLFIFGIL